MRRFLVPLGIAALLVVSASAFAEQGKSPTGARAQGEKAQKDKSRNDSARDDSKPASTGKFEVAPATRDVQGEFLAFGYSDTTIDGFAVDGVHVFDARVVPSSSESRSTGVESKGAQVRIETPSFRLLAHDNPEAVTRIDAKGLIVLTLPLGANVTTNAEYARFVVGNVTGVARGDGLVAEGNVLTAHDHVLLSITAPHGDFDVHREKLSAAIGRGHVGVEASFNHGESEVEQDIVSFGNVTMRTLKAEKGNLTLEVEGHGFDGRVLVLNVDGRVLGAERADDLAVLFDNSTIQHASTLEDVLDPDDDGLVAEYYVVFDPAAQAFQLLVSVPHYSVHTLSVTTLLKEVPPSVVIGVVVGVALLAPTAMLLFRRK